MNRKYNKSLSFFEKWIYNKATTNRDLKEEKELYHRTGFTGDYYDFDDAEKLISFIKTGKRYLIFCL